jgi:hypothetical protein
LSRDNCLPRDITLSQVHVNRALGRLEQIFWNYENLTICWCVIIVKKTATFHTDELLISEAGGKCNVPFHIVHFVNVVGMWVSVPVPPT